MSIPNGHTYVGVGVVVVSADGLVLLARRLAEPGQPLAVPGGKPEPGESMEACAARELHEETGLQIDPGATRTFAAVLADGWVVVGVRAILDAEAADARVQAREPCKIGDFTWIAPGERPAGLYPATATLLDRLAGAG